eukprot:m.226936 g.226936  ORF g.226936 m.226936 type:complete len:55 (+) comp25935_c1_seq12:3612-3776(+)
MYRLPIRGSPGAPAPHPQVKLTAWVVLVLTVVLTYVEGRPQADRCRAGRGGCTR